MTRRAGWRRRCDVPAAPAASALQGRPLQPQPCQRRLPPERPANGVRQWLVNCLAVIVLLSLGFAGRG